MSRELISRMMSVASLTTSGQAALPRPAAAGLSFTRGSELGSWVAPRALSPGWGLLWGLGCGRPLPAPRRHTGPRGHGPAPPG